MFHVQVKGDLKKIDVFHIKATLFVYISLYRDETITVAERR